MYGIAVLTPFNAVLSTFDYFSLYIPAQWHIDFVISFEIEGIGVLAILLCIAYADKGAHWLKINISFLLQAILLLILPCLYKIEQSTTKSGNIAFWVTFFVLSLIGILSAVS